MLQYFFRGGENWYARHAAVTKYFVDKGIEIAKKSLRIFAEVNSYTSNFS